MCTFFNILAISILKDLLQVGERFEEFWVLLELRLNELPIAHLLRVSLLSRREGEDLLRLDQRRHLLLLNSSFQNRKCRVVFTTQGLTGQHIDSLYNKLIIGH